MGHDELVEALLQPWAQAVGDGPDSLRTARGVVDRYAEPHRHHHGTTHLSEVLQALQSLAGPARLPAPVVCAAYWHDAVYDPRADDNEQQSAALAAAGLRRLGVPPEVVAEVVRLVLLTVTHDPAADDARGALLSDADLAVLAADPERYERYAAEVREEYAHLDDADFRRGRSAVLRELLDRPRLYATREGQRRWTDAARRNLRRELSRLAVETGGAGPRP